MDKQSPFDPSAIRWIAFDAVGTLIHPQPSVAEVYHRVARTHGSLASVAEVASRFAATFSRLEKGDLLSCGCSAESEPLHTCEKRELLRWRAIVDDVLNLSPSPCTCTAEPDQPSNGEAVRQHAFEELFTYFGQPRAWRCFPEVADTLKQLKARGFRLAVCSNFDGRLHRVMGGLPDLAPIELRVVSSEVGHRKPSPRFFESLFNATICPPGQMLFIGDDRQNDVEAARAVGLPALQVDRLAMSEENSVLRSLQALLPLLAR